MRPITQETVSGPRRPLWEDNYYTPLACFAHCAIVRLAETQSDHMIRATAMGFSTLLVRVFNIMCES